ncbi:MAG TPA: aminopeptidase P N-terminal domain-containing protein [Burkholderiaceae bacterium]
MMPYAARRIALLERLRQEGGGVAVLLTAPEAPRNADTDYPYRHDSNFYYLTGFAEPGAALVLAAKGDSMESVLFCREKDAAREIWDGFRYGPDAARTQFGFDRAQPIAALDSAMEELLADAPALYCATGSSAALDARVQGWLAAVRGRDRAGVLAPTRLHDLPHLLAEMRVLKDGSETALMRTAAEISARAHLRAMRATRPGMREYEIEAELLYEFRKSGAAAPAYPSIVASGANTCILHYGANDAQIADGALVLIDAGCEYGGYASDITRTYPANGRFSKPQRELYELVLAAQAAALAQAQPGRQYMAGHHAAVRVLAQGMLDLGLLTGDKAGTLVDVIARKTYGQFYMHGTGHWLGMDVHDTGSYRDLAAPAGPDRPYRPLAPGMTLTVEPGIYVRPAEGVPEQYWNIGIRIEDDILITETGHDILSHGVPKTVAEIEAVLAR